MAKFAYALLSIALLVLDSFALVEPNKRLYRNVHGVKAEAASLARNWRQITRKLPAVRTTLDEDSCVVGRDCSGTYSCPEPCVCEGDDVAGGFDCYPRNRDCVIGEQCYGNATCDRGCTCDADDVSGDFACFVHGAKAEAASLTKNWHQIMRKSATLRATLDDEGSCVVGRDCSDTYTCPEPCVCEGDDVAGGYHCYPRNRDCIIGEQCYGNATCDRGCSSDADDVSGDFSCISDA